MKAVFVGQFNSNNNRQQLCVPSHEQCKFLLKSAYLYTQKKVTDAVSIQMGRLWKSAFSSSLFADVLIQTDTREQIQIQRKRKHRELVFVEQPGSRENGRN